MPDTPRLPRDILGHADVVVDGRQLAPGMVAHRRRTTAVTVETGRTWAGKPEYGKQQVATAACRPAPTEDPGLAYLEMSASVADRHGAVACADKKCFPKAARGG
jgi:hypothetical protein